MGSRSPGGNYWLESPKPHLGDSLDESPQNVDVVVVGTGVTGLMAATWLGRAGLSVLALDKHQIGTASSARNAGIMVLGYKLSPTALVNRFGLDVAISLYQLSLDAFAFIGSLIEQENLDCDFIQAGHLEVAAKHSHVAAMQQVRAFFEEHLGHPTHWVSRGELSNFLQSSRYSGGYFDPSGRCLHPRKYVLALVRLAKAAGVSLCGNAPVSRVTRTPTGFRVDVGSRVIHTRVLVVATNAYADRVSPWLQRRVLAVGSHMVATEVLPAELQTELIKGRHTVADSKRFLYYFRLSPDRSRLLFGGRTRLAPSSGRRDVQLLRRAIAEVFPQLLDIGIEYAWSGNVAFTRSYLPHLGNHNGFYYALGYNGGGVAMGSYLGARLAERVLGTDSRLVIDNLPFRAFPRIRGWSWFLPAAHIYQKLVDTYW